MNGVWGKFQTVKTKISTVTKRSAKATKKGTKALHSAVARRTRKRRSRLSLERMESL
ncbi:hypothetical protein FH972_021108 [Carpinus fangiana]|uniref:Uncharacterized protein n=1 Tax=Carpinus fangiana TaxID=176857 RepID=A0A5N6KNY4_9ROSI|nr:hypothetical protein FH972_021108 [Carpinus fangiana]